MFQKKNVTLGLCKKIIIISTFKKNKLLKKLFIVSRSAVDFRKCFVVSGSEGFPYKTQELKNDS